MRDTLPPGDEGMRLDPYCAIEMTFSEPSSSTTVRVASKRGSSNEVGSASTCFLPHKNMSDCVYKNRAITYESNTPNVMAYGVHLNDSGMSSFEQIVLPVSSSNLAAGNRAARRPVRN